METETLCYLSLHDLVRVASGGERFPPRSASTRICGGSRCSILAFQRSSPFAGDRALKEAKRAGAEIAAGRWRGPLHGVPYGVKDIIETAGVRTTHGSIFFRIMCRPRTPSASPASGGRALSCLARPSPTSSQPLRPPSIAISGPRGIHGNSTASPVGRAAGPRQPWRRGCVRSPSARIREDPFGIPPPSVESLASSQRTDG